MDAAGSIASSGRPGIRLRTVLGDLSAGAVCSLTTATFAVSYGALIFAGPLAPAQPAGLVAMLTACIVVGLGTALFSSLRCASAAPDGNSVVVLATMAAGIGQAMGPGASLAALSATVLVMLMVTAMSVGAAMVTLGALRAGRIVRFIPYQVMAGFLGAGGWSLAVGGLGVGLGAPVELAALSDPGSVEKLAAAGAVGIVLFVLVPRLKHPLALPATIVAAVAIHHAVAAWLGVPPAVQARLGWLLNVPARLPWSPPWSSGALYQVDWQALETAAPGLLAAVLVAVVTLMLSTSAIELATAKDADIDRELLAGGLSCMASGLLGGTSGTPSVSRALLLLGAGATTRLAPCVAAVLAGLVPMLYPQLLGLVPRSMLGGMLIFLGLQLLDQWVRRSRRNLSRAEWATVLLVIAVTSRFGFVAGVFSGVALGCATFAVAYSRVAPASARYRGDVASSNVSRPASDRALLHADAEALLVLHLHGFLFFGTANRLLQDVRAEIAALPGRLRFLVLDFRNVEGIDGSALSSFARIGQIAAAERIVLVMTAVPANVAARLDTLKQTAAEPWHVFPTLDAGLEWCEETRLAELQGNRSGPPAVREQLATAFGGDMATAERFIAQLGSLSFVAGEVLIHQHDTSDELMFIESGRVAILIRFREGPEVRVRTVGEGAMIGEIGFLLGEPRTATIRAETDCRALCLDRITLGRIERDDPELGFAFHRAMAQFLAHRLVDKDGMIAALMRGTR
jgi:SulP family sulfate permease